MIFFVAAAIVGLAVGMAGGGSFRHVGDVRFVGAPLVWVAVAAQVALGYPPARGFPTAGRTAIVVVSFALVGVFLARNLRTGSVRFRSVEFKSVGLRAGLMLLAIGWALNMAVVAANGGMPVSRHAVAVSGIEGRVDVSQGQLWKHIDADSSTRLSPLGDVLAVGFVPAAFSVGDVSMMAGIAVTIASATRPRRDWSPEPAVAW